MQGSARAHDVLAENRSEGTGVTLGEPTSLHAGGWLQCMPQQGEEILPPQQVLSVPRPGSYGAAERPDAPLLPAVLRLP